MTTMAADTTVPAKPITLLVPFPAGGPTDQMARLLGEVLGGRTGQTVIVDNRPGAGGQIAGTALLHAPADGRTLLMGETSVLASNHRLYTKFAYDPQRDFQPITPLMSMPMVLFVPKDSSVNSVKELVELGHAEPLNYASQGAGSLGHLLAEVFASRTRVASAPIPNGIQMVHVPYKGSAPAMVALIGTQVDLLFDGLGAGRPYVLDGRIRALAIAAPQRSALLPDVPTMAEAGYPGVQASVWYGVVARAGTPLPVAEKLNKDIAAALEDPRFSRQFREQGYNVGGMGIAQFRDFIKSESEYWGKVIKENAIAVD